MIQPIGVMIQMSNIFRSKEIYKRIPGVSSDNNPLRAVQGMYVSGEYRPPYYIDSFVQVSNIKTNKAKIEDYTSVTKDLTADPIINIIGVDCSDLDITYYTQAQSDLSADPIINIIGVDCSDLDILCYTQDSKDLTADPIVNIIGVDCSDIDITFYKETPINTNPDHTIRIKSITTSKAVVAQDTGDTV